MSARRLRSVPARAAAAAAGIRARQAQAAAAAAAAGVGVVPPPPAPVPPAAAMPPIAPLGLQRATGVKGVSDLVSWTPTTTGSTITRWLEIVNALGVLHDWTDPIKINLMPVKIIGNDPSRYVSQIINLYGAALTWSQLCTLLIGRYEVDIDQQQLQCELGEVKQNNMIGENINDYTERFNTVAERLTEMEEKTKISYYLSNMSKTLKNRVMMGQDVTDAALSQVLIFALRAEKAEKEEQTQIAAVRLQQQQINNQHAHIYNQRNYNYNNSIPTNYSRNKRKRDSAENNNNKPPTSSTATSSSDVSSLSYPSSSAPSKKSKDISQVRCYNCDELGHYRTRCPKPNRDNNRDRRQTKG